MFENYFYILITLTGMRKMRKSLVALILALSSCFSQQYKCPDDEDLLRAGFRMYSASRIIDSTEEDDKRMARNMYCMASDFYFECRRDHLHEDRHYQEAEERASNFFGLSPKQRERFKENLMKIRRDIALTSSVK